MVTEQLNDGDLTLVDAPAGAGDFTWRNLARELSRPNLVEFARHAYARFFDSFDWDAAKGKAAAPPRTLLQILNDQTLVTGELYKQHPPLVMTYSMEVAGRDSIMVGGRLIRVDGQLIRLERYPNDTFKASRLDESSPLLVGKDLSRVVAYTESDLRAKIEAIEQTSSEPAR